MFSKIGSHEIDEYAAPTVTELWAEAGSVDAVRHHEAWLAGGLLKHSIGERTGSPLSLRPSRFSSTQPQFPGGHLHVKHSIIPSLIIADSRIGGDDPILVQNVADQTCVSVARPTRAGDSRGNWAVMNLWALAVLAGVLPLVIWSYLLLARGRFWQVRRSLAPMTQVVEVSTPIAVI